MLAGVQLHNLLELELELVSDRNCLSFVCLSTITKGHHFALRPVGNVFEHIMVYTQFQTDTSFTFYNELLMNAMLMHSDYLHQ